eukprot:TRINITY_DN6199_c0_g1_i3.p1 TRINITY_DN6199_c0_g1~~TRINITY_DN6199_c0_g1_i3.p1  ORF type:complete len:357 (+),score=87.13 TRINITY_DN6199_c0_g1_i3:511-1581(+)
MQITVSFPDAGFPDFSFPATVNSVVEEVIEAAAKEWDVEPTSFELSFAGEVLSPTSTLASHGLEAGSQLTASKAHEGYCYVISTTRDDGHHKDYYNNLSLEEARQYAVHLKVFVEEADGDVDDELFEEKIPDYDFELLPELIGVCHYGESWMTLSEVELSYIPEAATAKKFSWRDFVVPVPALEDQTEYKLKRRKCDEKKKKKKSKKESKPIKKVPKDGYRLTVVTYEPEDELQHVETFDNLSLETTRLYATVLANCGNLSNCEPDSEEEEEVFDKISDELGIECDARDLMDSLFGIWHSSHCDLWREVQSVELENIQNRDLIKKIDHKEFAKTAYELAMAEKKKQKAEEDSDSED